MNEQIEANSSIVTDIYLARRRIESEMPDCWEKTLALTKLDEATFWLKSIPVEMR